MRQRKIKKDDESPLMKAERAYELEMERVMGTETGKRIAKLDMLINDFEDKFGVPSKDWYKVKSGNERWVVQIDGKEVGIEKD
jgi:hypothetical protein